MADKDNCRCANHYYDKKPKLKLQSQTTNKATYKPLPIQKPTQFQPPKVVQKSYDPDVLQSSYKSQYNKPPVTTQQISNPLNPAESYIKNKPHVPFYSDTSYKDSYKPKPIVVEKQPTYQYKPSGTKFEGESCYKSTFQPKKNPDLQPSSGTSTAQDYINRKPKIPFEGQSSYKDTFKQHEVKVQKQPEYKYSKNPNKFQGQSSYKQTFKQPPKQSYKSDTEYCPAHPGKIALK